jgi:hypothetical protein
MGAELERSDDAEIATRTANRPEQVGVLGRASRANLTIRCDDLDGEQTIDGQSELASQVTIPAMQRQAGDPRR